MREIRDIQVLSFGPVLDNFNRAPLRRGSWDPFATMCIHGAQDARMIDGHKQSPTCAHCKELRPA